MNEVMVTIILLVVAVTFLVGSITWLVGHIFGYLQGYDQGLRNGRLIERALAKKSEGEGMGDKKRQEWFE